MIYGDSGCGKSTLLKLIFRSLVENKGDIFLGKENYSNISDEQLHRIIGFIMQDSYVFDDTVLNNITLGRNLSEGIVQDALLQAKAQDVSTLNGNAKELSAGIKEKFDEILPFSAEN